MSNEKKNHRNKNHNKNFSSNEVSHQIKILQKKSFEKDTFIFLSKRYSLKFIQPNFQFSIIDIDTQKITVYDGIVEYLFVILVGVRNTYKLYNIIVLGRFGLDYQGFVRQAQSFKMSAKVIC